MVLANSQKKSISCIPEAFFSGHLRSFICPFRVSIEKGFCVCVCMHHPPSGEE